MPTTHDMRRRSVYSGAFWVLVAVLAIATGVGYFLLFYALGYCGQ